MKKFYPSLSITHQINTSCRILFLILVFIHFSLQLFAQPSGFQDQLRVQGGVGSGLFSTTGITFDKDGKMYAIEAKGKVWAVRFDGNGNETRYLMLDISDEVLNTGDLGLVSIVLHPDFLSNGYFYLMYAVNRQFLIDGTDGGDNADQSGSIVRVTRYTADMNASPSYTSVVVNSRFVLLGTGPTDGIPILGTNHGGGCLLFGNDETLLVSTGDGGTGGDTGSLGNYQEAIDLGIITAAQNVGNYRCQMNDALNGKVLRINPANGDGISSNPLYNSGSPRSAESRMWAKGFRNPFRMTLIPNTGGHSPEEANPGIIVVGDVGSSKREEINTITGPNQNFGWPYYEGIDEDNLNTYDDPAYLPASYRKPIFEYREWAAAANVFLNQNTKIELGSAQFPYENNGDPFVGSTIILGDFYQGTSYPTKYQNALFFTDFTSKWIKVMKLNASYEPESIENFAQLPDFVLGTVYNPIEDAVYYLTGNALPCDQIRRFVYAPANTPPVAKIEVDVNHGIAPLAVAFSGIKSYDADGTSLTYEWTIDDNPVFSTGLAPHYLFNPSGNAQQVYKVKLKVTDESGAGLSTTDSVYVYANNTEPVINSTSLDNVNIIPANQNYSLSLAANVTDAETANSNLTYAWTIAFAHNGHEHKNPPLLGNNISTVLPATTCEIGDATYWYKIYLTITDPQGFAKTIIKNIELNCSGSSQTLTFNAITNQEITLNTTNNTVTASATSSVGATPLYYFNIAGPAYIIDNQIKLSGKPGKITVRATQHGNGTYRPALPVEQTFDVDRTTTHYIMNFDVIADKLITDAPFNLIAGTFPNSQTVNFMLISGPATLSGNMVTLTGTAGTVKIRAYYEGDYNQRGVYQDRTFTVNNPVIPITADEIIYGDALSSNWQNFSTAASLTINNATSQFLNTHSIKINNPANNETLDFRYAGLPFNRTDFPDGLDFWVYNDGNSSFPLQVQSFTSSSGGASNNVNVLAESKKWTHVLLEWSLFGNPAQIGKILIRFNQSQSESLFFDGIRLVHCGDMYSTKTGNWNDQTVWSCGRLPVMTDIIRIEQPHNVTVLSGTTATIRLLQLLGTITVQPSGVLDIKDF